MCKQPKKLKRVIKAAKEVVKGWNENKNYLHEVCDLARVYGVPYQGGLIPISELEAAVKEWEAKDDI